LFTACRRCYEARMHQKLAFGPVVWSLLGGLVFIAIVLLVETLIARPERGSRIREWAEHMLLRLNQAAVIVLFSALVLSALFLLLTRIVEPLLGFFSGTLSEQQLKLGAAIAIIELLAIFSVAFALLFVRAAKDDPPNLETNWGGFGESLGGWTISTSLAYLIGAVAFAVALAAVSIATLQPVNQPTPASTPSPTPTPPALGAQRNDGAVTSSSNPWLSNHPTFTYAPNVSCGSTSTAHSHPLRKHLPTGDKCPPNAVSPCL